MLKREYWACIGIIALAFLGMLAIAELEKDTNLITGSFASSPDEAKTTSIPLNFSLGFVIVFIVVLLIYLCKIKR